MTAINGKLFVATRDNKLWWRDPVGQAVNWQLIGHADNVAAMAAINGKLFAATRDNKLWWRDPVGQAVNWQLIGHADNVVAMAAIDGDSLYIIQGSALVRANPTNGHWQQLDAGDEWVGATHITIYGDSLHIIVQETMLRDFWRQKLRAIQNLFNGFTSEDDEDRALAIITSAGSAGELGFLINHLTWEALDDDLDEPDLDQIARLLSQLLDRRDYSVNTLLRGFFQNPETLQSRGIEAVANEFRQAFTALAAASRHAFVDQLLARRDTLLDDIGLMALRGLPTNVRVFRAVIDVIEKVGQHRSDELRQLSWQLFYTDRIGSQLEQAEYRLLLQTLPDLIDPSLVDQQRVAFFDMLRRWDGVFAAMEELVKLVGNERQKSDMRYFMQGRRLFMDNFAQQLPPPDVLQEIIRTIAAFFREVTNELQRLRESIQAAVQVIADFSVAALLGTANDDIAVNATNGLFAQHLLALLPSDYKLEIMNRMLDGAVVDEEEQAILKIVAESKARSAAEFLQLVAGVSWEKLSNSFDGQEYDDLVGLFVF